MRTIAFLLLPLPCLALLLQGAACGAEPLLPDLTVWSDEPRGYLHGWRIDWEEMPSHRLLRLTAAVPNQGTGPMEVRGDEVQEDGTQDVYQRIYDTEGGVTERLAGTFTFHEAHDHIHFDDYAEYRLRQVVNGSEVGPVVAGGEKVSFCLLDSTSYDLGLPGAPSSKAYTQCEQIQGISVGWADVYPYWLADQWIDVTAVAAGSYWLEIAVDPLDRLLESDEANNTDRILIVLPAGGDMNMDGRMDLDDVAPFVLGLTDAVQYSETYGGADPALYGDIDADGDQDLDDVASFVELLTGGSGSSAHSVPEPTSLLLLGMGLSIGFVVRRRSV